MKKLVLSLMMMAVWMGVSAMSFERAQAEALYLTDKMAYELNLNDQQYNDAYEINLDYFLRIDSPSDLYGSYYTYRLYDLRCILHDWQYSLLTAADYFLRPILWRAGGWYFPIYSYYNRGYFYYSRPSVWVTYYGGHGRSYYRDGFYGNRRPHWNGGLRGHDMHRPAVVHSGSRGGGRRISGNGYHIDLDNHRSDGRSGNHSGVGHNGNVRPEGGNRSGGMNSGNHDNMNHGNTSRGSVNRGNSFDSSSSRMSGSMSRGGSSSYGGSSRGSSMSSSRSSSPSYGGSSRGGSMGMSRGSSPSYGGSSRGSSMGMSRGSSMGGSRGGGGSSRGGRR